MRIVLKGLVILEVLENGYLMRRIKTRNLVVQSAESVLCNLLAGVDQANNTITSIALGTGSTQPTVADTSLENEVARVPVSGYTFLAPNSVEFSATVDQATANGTTVWELGLFTAGNTLFARTVLSMPVAKDSTFYFNIKWLLSINLVS